MVELADKSIRSQDNNAHSYQRANHKESSAAHSYKARKTQRPALVDEAGLAQAREGTRKGAGDGMEVIQ